MIEAVKIKPKWLKEQKLCATIRQRTNTHALEEEFVGALSVPFVCEIETGRGANALSSSPIATTKKTIHIRHKENIFLGIIRILPSLSSIS